MAGTASPDLHHKMELPLEVDNTTIAAGRKSQEDFVLLDCREADEFELVNIDDTQFIPMSELQQRVGELDDHKEQRIVVFCHHGARSLMVARWLRAQGFTAQSMIGGIDAWAAEIDPSLPRY